MIGVLGSTRQTWKINTFSEIEEIVSSSGLAAMNSKSQTVA
jgi:hypothetical protein